MFCPCKKLMMHKEITNLADGGQPASFAASQNRSPNQAEIADANPDGKSRSVPRAACAPRRLHHSQSLGRRHRKTARRDGFAALATTSLGLANTLGSVTVS